MFHVGRGRTLKVGAAEEQQLREGKFTLQGNPGKAVTLLPKTQKWSRMQFKRLAES